jgi:cell division protein FtsL
MKTQMRHSWVLFVFLSSWAFAQVQYEEEDYEVEETEDVYELEENTEYYIEEDDDYQNATIEPTTEYVYVENEYPTNSITIESEPLAFDTSYKSKYKNKAYDYSRKTKQKEPTEPINLEPRGSLELTGVAQVIFNIFLVLAVALILFLLYMALRNFKFNRKPAAKPISNFDETEEEIENLEDVDSNSLYLLIEKAKKEGNYRLAIRHYFLLYLRKLQEKKVVEYHMDKTNSDYMSEIKNEGTLQQFVKVSYFFEYVWYGKKPINLETFNGLESLFNEQISLVK